MSAQSHVLLSLPIKATAALTANRFATLIGALPAAGAGGAGVAMMDAAIGEFTSVAVIGTRQVEAGAAIAAGALVEADVNGRAITKAAGVALGRALEAAGALGDVIEVLLASN